MFEGSSIHVEASTRVEIELAVRCLWIRASGDGLFDIVGACKSTDHACRDEDPELYHWQMILDITMSEIKGMAEEETSGRDDWRWGPRPYMPRSPN